jgi:3-phenylpropionate/trans-cinnamate dioxygenase ferredoxin reductase subunit
MNRTRTETFVIVGGGLAAGTAAQTLRDEGFHGQLVIFADEHHRPYERPPLSKGYLTGTDDLQSAYVHSAQWYAEHNVDLRSGTAVTAIDPRGRTVKAGDHRQRYDKLLLCTGARPRRLPMADDSGAPVTYLRTMEDAQRIKAALRPGCRLVIIGGGWIGLEVAAAASGAGSLVTLVEKAELPLLRILGPEVAGIFAALHHDHGVDLRTSATVSSIRASGGEAVVRLGDGSQLSADLVVVGIGVLPNTALAEAAGLPTGNGILVDQQLRTFDPDIFAAGDVAAAYHPILGRLIRVEHWDNAIRQGGAAAENMLGHGVSYERLPYFFTDQYEVGMEYVGSVGPEGFDQVVLRRSPQLHAFTAFWLHQNRVVAGMHANDWDAIEPIRGIVGGRGLGEALRDESIPLPEIAAFRRGSADPTEATRGRR